jgi:RNA polymerase sigma factor (sigma-70 family)
VRDEEFTAIYRKLGQRLYNYIRWVTGNAPSCDDILQTVLIKAWHHDGGPRDEREREKWLFTVAINACRDYFRSESRYTRLCDRFGREWQDFDEPEESPRIWELLKELHDSDRSILYLHIKAGYSYAEIGSVLSMTEGQVRIRAFRALKQLRGLLSKEDV